MRGYIQSARPAGAAIAAVLALGSTCSFAQETVPDAVSPPVVVPPLVVAPAASAPQPMVQPTASVEERLDAAVAASEAETAAKPAAGRPNARTASTPVRTAPRAQVERPAAAPSVERAEARPMAAAPEREAAVGPAPAVSEAAPATPHAAEARDVGAADTGAKESLLWALGGGVLLLAGIFMSETVNIGVSALQLYSEEGIILAVSLLLGLICALVPAVQAYRTDISRVLAGS